MGGADANMRTVKLRAGANDDCEDESEDASDSEQSTGSFFEAADSCLVRALGATSERTEREQQERLKRNLTSTTRCQTMDIPQRFRSPVLLLWGGVFGVLGFLMAFAIGVLHYFTEKDDFHGKPFKSGHGYWPATVSEMVYEWNSAEGRIFFGFCLISAFLIFTSWYPFELRNVFTGSESLRFCGFDVYWITFRQLVPVVGLLMLISISTVPSALAKAADQFSISLHLTGAAMMFVGYIMAELKCLDMCWMRGSEMAEFLDIEGNERVIRRLLMVVVLLFYVIFCVCQVLLVLAVSSDPPVCCADEFGERGVYLSSFRSIIKNTASGRYLLLKVVSFMSEVISGLALIGSHIVIWYFCEERRVNFGEDAIEAVFDEERNIDIHHKDHRLYSPARPA